MVDPSSPQPPTDALEAHPGEAWRSLPARLEDPDSSPWLSRQQMRNWSLVLSARLIPFRTNDERRRRQLLVPAENYQAALRELRQYERENRGWPPPPPGRQPVQDNAVSTLWVLIALAVFHNVTVTDPVLFDLGSVAWLTLGNAHAGKIMAGEWWRACTALTLHSNWLHLLGNLVIGGVFIVRLCRDLGAGLGWSLLLASGILGNLVNAWLHAPEHRAVGASTAVFGAVGLLAGLNLVRYRSNLRPRRRWLLPIAGAFGLLAMLGVGGERTDLGAHLFGLLCGLALGVGSGVLLERFGRPAPWLNRTLAVLSAAAVAGAWLLAIRHGG